MEYTIKNFWDWFEVNQTAYQFINDVEDVERDRLMDTICNELQKLNENLWVEIGGNPDDGMELIVTAEGNTDYFAMVENVIAQAPEIKNWMFTAFIPPDTEGPWIVEYAGIKLNSEEMWFLPLEEEENPKSIGLRVCTPNYELIKDNEYFMSAVYNMLESLLGEKTFALDVDYVEAGQVPEDPEEEGMMELQEVLEYVNWEKTNRHME